MFLMSIFVILQRFLNERFLAGGLRFFTTCRKSLKSYTARFMPINNIPAQCSETKKKDASGLQLSPRDNIAPDSLIHVSVARRQQFAIGNDQISKISSDLRDTNTTYGGHKQEKIERYLAEARRVQLRNFFSPPTSSLLFLLGVVFWERWIQYKSPSLFFTGRVLASILYIPPREFADIGRVTQTRRIYCRLPRARSSTAIHARSIRIGWSRSFFRVHHQYLSRALLDTLVSQPLTGALFTDEFNLL